jgi:hypothetical protein
MMMTMIRSGGAALLMLLFLLPAGDGLYGQRRDFQSWFEVEVEKDLKNGIDLSAEIEQRFESNSTRYDRSLLTLAAGYDLGDYLKASGGARMLMVADREMNLHPRYRVHADATGSLKLLDADLSLRVRFQYGFEEFIYFTDFIDNNLMNRVRLKGAYHIFGTRIGLFASAESWGMFQSRDGRFFKRMRYSAGGSYTVSFRSEFSLRYILEDEFNQVNPLQSHILVVGYACSL